MILLVDEKWRSYLVKGTSDVHTNYGVIYAKDLKKKKPGDRISTHTGREFFILEPNVIDLIKKAKRGPQTMTLKDCSLIAGHTGIRSGSKVVDSGTGSGVMAMFLANMVAPATVTTYEVRDDFAKIAKANFEKAGMENIKVKMKSIYDGIAEKNLDLINLDLPEPWLVVEHARKSLKVGGYLSSYSPSIEQSKKLVDKLDGFMAETFECILRSWNMETVRPHSRMIAHTGFITIARWTGKGE